MRADPAILQMKYADIVAMLAEREGFTYDEALKIFYESQTYQLMSEGVSDMHCMSELYLVEEIISESLNANPSCGL